jgi:N-acyl-D-amino-acid deacylase
VAPGFIDITSHADQNFSLFQNPGQDYLLAQGVTTILVGNCGASLAPLGGPGAIESIRKWSESGEVSVNWLSMKEFLDELVKHRPGVNVATLIGHGTLRRTILKGETRALAPEEMRTFEELFTRAITEGAFGLSTGLVYSHEVDATRDEILQFLRLAKETKSIYKTHLRHEGADLVPAVNEVVQLGKESGAPIVISHFKAIGRKAWHSFPRTIQMIERANDGGAKIHFDISPYQRTGSFLYLLLPRWARKAGFRAMLERMADPQQRSYMITDLGRQTLDASRYIIASSPLPGMNGKTIAEVAKRAGTNPEEIILELLETSRGRVTVLGKTLSFRNIVLGIRNSLGAVASDGSGVYPDLEKSGRLVHPRSTGVFAHFLHRFVRERQDLTWEEAIRKITSFPAFLAGFP